MTRDVVTMTRDAITSFRVDAQLWKKARIHAIENDITMKKLIETLLKMELKEKRGLGS